MNKVLVITQDYDYPKFIMKYEYYATPGSFANRICQAHAYNLKFKKIHLDQYDPNDKEDLQIVRTIESLCSYPKGNSEERCELFNAMWELGRSVNINVEVC